AVLSLAVIATCSGSGPFVAATTWESLIQLQSFTAAISIILFLVAILNLEKSSNEAYLEKRTKELEELYRKDALTGLWNRYRIEEFLHLELERLKRDHMPFGVLFIDIDDFKIINDTHGHLEGDRILCELSELILHNVREIDVAGRRGGEEFIIISSNTNQDNIRVIANKLLSEVRKNDFGLPEKVTISIGGTIGQHDDTELSIINKADQALYESKYCGKNTASFEFTKPR
ncbi:GGDEF domain-containing protein, partial [Oleiphilus sp. HI0067]